MGKHKLKVYMPNKPIRRYFFFFIILLNKKDGFKAFALCESSSGYVL